MNSQDIQTAVYDYCTTRGDFTAPYGVLTGEHTNRNGKKYKSVTFGKSRTLDATVEIYNSKFIVLKTSNTSNMVFNDVDSLLDALKQL